MHFSPLLLTLTAFAFTSIFTFLPKDAQSETLIPRSMPGDKGKYYLLESMRTGNIVRSLHKRVGIDTVDFTRTETNCKNRQMRVLGSGEGEQDIKESPTPWFDLVPGSSKSDLANFVCKW
ncbi:hypothetical protein SAMN05216417_103131 [Nitrosospira multiformis]|uniref:Uncharacterized protein n=1 Tax=Nitrosospira multiformis TaxID=1231 RepID=A0A1I7G3D5_9PROT|nr:hypothetical protein SAMN05216417_103131 [Nitrosospira multiformis]